MSMIEQFERDLEHARELTGEPRRTTNSMLGVIARVLIAILKVLVDNRDILRAQYEFMRARRTIE